MKGWPRVLAIVIGGLIAVVILALVLVALFFPADRARQIAVAQLETRLHRPVAIADAHVRIFPTFKVDLRGIQIGGPAPAPNVPVISVAALRVGLRLLPLLQRRIDVSAIDVDQPRILMILTQQPPPSAGAPPARPAGKPLALRVRHLGIHDGAIAVWLPDGTPFLHLAGLSEDLVADMSAGGDVDVKGQLAIDTLRVQMAGAEIGQGIRIRLDHDLHYEQGRDLLTVRNGVLHVGDVPVAVRGTVTGLRGAEPVLDVSLQGGPAQLSDIVGMIPVHLMPQSAGEVKSSGTLTVNGAVRGTMKQPDFTVDVLLDNGRIEAPKVLPQPIDGIRLKLHARPDTVDVQEFAARSARTSVRGSVTLTDYRRSPAFRLAADADLDLGAISGLLIPPDSMRLGGSVSARLVAEGRTSAPADANLDGLIHFASVSADGKALPHPVTNGNGDIILHNQAVAMRGLSLKFGSSDLVLDGSLTNPLALMPPPKGKAMAIPVPRGRPRFEFALRSDLLDLNELLAGPQMKINLALPPADGVIALTCGRLLLQRIEATNVKGRVTVDHGIVQLQNLGMNSLGGTASMNGSIDLSAMEPPAARGRAITKGVAPSPQARPRVDLTADAQGIGVDKLFALAPALDRFGHLNGFLTGALSVRASLRGSLTDSLALDLPSLASSGNLEILGGRLTSQPIQQALVGFINVPQLNNISIEDWKQAFTIEQGRININGLNIRAGDVELTANGWQSIDGTTEMTIDLMLPRALSSAISSKLPAEAAAVLLSGSDPRVYLPLQLKGKAVSPTVSLNTSQLTAAASQQAEARLNQEKARLADEARRQAQGLIQKNLPDTLRKGLGLDSLQIKKDVLNRLGKIFGK